MEFRLKAMWFLPLLQSVPVVRSLPSSLDLRSISLFRSRPVLKLSFDRISRLYRLCSYRLYSSRRHKWYIKSEKQNTEKLLKRRGNDLREREKGREKEFLQFKDDVHKSWRICVCTSAKKHPPFCLSQDLPTNLFYVPAGSMATTEVRKHKLQPIEQNK